MRKRPSSIPLCASGGVLGSIAARRAPGHGCIGSRTGSRWTPCDAGRAARALTCRWRRTRRVTFGRAGFQREEDCRLLRQALDHLSPDDRALITLFYFEECSYTRISEIRGESLPRIKGLLHRARQRLKAHFVRLRGEDGHSELLADAPADPTLDSGRLFAL